MKDLAAFYDYCILDLDNVPYRFIGTQSSHLFYSVHERIKQEEHESRIIQSSSYHSCTQLLCDQSYFREDDDSINLIS